MYGEGKLISMHLKKQALSLLQDFSAHFPSLLYLSHQLHFEVDSFQPVFPGMPAHSYEEV